MENYSIPASVAAIVVGLLALTWSADRFVDGAIRIAEHLGVSSLLIGMVVVGFGTSAPEMIVSAFAAWDGRGELALGNAYGSNIANIAVILGISAVMAPIRVKPGVLRFELPLLLAVSIVAVSQLVNGDVSRTDAVVLLLLFAAAMLVSIRRELKAKAAAASGAAIEAPEEVSGAAAATGDDDDKESMSTGMAVFWLVAGLGLMAAASRGLVWGAVNVATALGVGELVIGLTIVAIGTSLPELAASVVSARKGEADLALGNVLGSNLFNTLAVVGIAGAISPFPTDPVVLVRDVPVMLGLTAALFVLGWPRGGTGRIGRRKGALLLAAYAGYLVWLILAETARAAA